MKKISAILIGAILCTLVLFSCTSNAQKVIGKVNNNKIEIKFDKQKITDFLISQGYSNIESIDIKYESAKAILQIIGTKDKLANAIEVKLSVKGNDIIFPNPKDSDDPQLMVSHSCSGSPCGSCSFTYSGFSIAGCKCNQSGGKCNHTISTKFMFEIADFYGLF